MIDRQIDIILISIFSHESEPKEKQKGQITRIKVPNHPLRIKVHLSELHTSQHGHGLSTVYSPAQLLG